METLAAFVAVAANTTSTAATEPTGSAAPGHSRLRQMFNTYVPTRIADGPP
jgi:hypothetical protein